MNKPTIGAVKEPLMRPLICVMFELTFTKMRAKEVHIAPQMTTSILIVSVLLESSSELKKLDRLSTSCHSIDAKLFNVEDTELKAAAKTAAKKRPVIPFKSLNVVDTKNGSI
jgi:hypothetical protein